MSLFSRAVLRSVARSTKVAEFQTGIRAMSSDHSGLKQRIAELIPEKVAEVIEVKKAIGDQVMGTCTVEQAYGGMRSVKSMVYETSLLDPEEGIRMRGYTLTELQEKLPSATDGTEPLAEGLIWLLMTGDIPTEAQTTALSAEFNQRSTVPQHVKDMIASFPRDMHPMTKFSAGILALQTESEFAKAYRDGANKATYWEHTYEDAMNCMARLPEVAALVYRTSFHDGVVAANPGKDMGYNYGHMMGYSDNTLMDLMRLYLVIHSDHEGGNVSAHTHHLVGSALSDPYLSLSAAMNGLAGPLHGLANQEVLRWLKGVKAELGDKPINKETLTDFTWSTLNSGKVVPGYGHAVLRKTDPRYTVQREFALKHLPDDEMFRLVSTLYEVVPGILTELGKVKNPWPNVDAHSGVLLQHYGIMEEDYYTVMFGVSRALGCLPMQVWSRALGLPLERPKSVTTEWIKKNMM